MSDKIEFSWIEQPITGYVYFINFSQDSPIKIGYAQNVDTRLNELQIGNPYELSVLAAIPGNEKCEEVLHSYFYKYKIRGEWFWPVWDLQRIVNKFKKINKFMHEHLHRIREVISEKSGESLVEIIPSIELLDFQIKQTSF